VTPRPHFAFFSTVHPHPWAPSKGTFNQVLLDGMAEHATVTAIIPVPWTERLGRPTHPANSYDVRFPTFRFVPRLAPLALATQLEWSVKGTLQQMVRPDAILSYWSDPDGTVAVRWAKEINRPAAILAGGSDVMLLASSGRRRVRILRTLAAADHVFTIGRRIREVLLEAGIPPERTSVFARGVDRRHFVPGDRSTARGALNLPQDRPILLWVGRMVDVKGLDVLLNALSDPAVQQVNPLLLLAGDGPERASLVALARHLGVDRSVRFLGRTAHAVLPTLYRAADLTVLSSRSEGVPNVLLESLACGTPFVGSDVGSIRDLTERPEAVLAPPDRPDLLARLIATRLPVGWVRSEWVDVPDSREASEWMASELARLAGR